MMKTYSRTWLLALSVALVVLNASSLSGNWRLQQEAEAARQQAAAWKIYALSAHGHGLRVVELETQATARQPMPPNRFSF